MAIIWIFNLSLVTYFEESVINTQSYTEGESKMVHKCAGVEV